MSHNGQYDGLVTRIALGSAAGLAGTLAIGAVMTAEKQLIGEDTSPMQRDPGEMIVNKAEQLLPERTRRRIPRKAEQFAAKALGFEYGMSYGAMYAVVRPHGGSVVMDGLALGLANWAIGFLGWIPAAKVAPPIWEHKPKQIIAPLVEHIVYGIATVATYNALDSLLHKLKQPM